MARDLDRRGERKPMDGRGRGRGVKGGNRAGRNPQPCSPTRGYGKGKGRKRE